MSPEAQRIAIAEWCGWSQIEDLSEIIMMTPGTVIVGYPPHDAIVGKKERLPNYLGDLNAIHEALTKAIKEELGVAWADYLYEVARTNHEDKDVALAMATASQRAEALLKTIGKWQDDPTPVLVKDR